MVRNSVTLFLILIGAAGCGGAVEQSPPVGPSNPPHQAAPVSRVEPPKPAEPSGSVEPAKPTETRTPPAVPSNDELYADAIRKAAVFEQANVLQVKTIPPDTARVKVVTWTRYDYKLGASSVGVNVWVTLVPEVREICRGFKGAEADIDLRLKQLLGLPLTAGYTQFVEMEVRREDIFRPCPNPDPQLSTCTDIFPQGVSPDHATFIATQSLSSFKLPGGYPWTRLGYTFDWSPEAKSRYGASEFVVRKGSKVNVTSITKSAAYCAPQG
jgi:hypothetical protein